MAEQVSSLKTGIKYKDTPIGKIPVDWEVVGLGELAAPIKNAFSDGPFGSNLKLEDYVDSGIPVLQGKNITKNRLEWFDIRFVTKKKAKEHSRSLATIGDILMTKIGTVGCVAIVNDLRGYEYALIPANLMKITLDRNKVNANFLYQFLLWPITRRRIVDVSSQTAQPALSLKTMKTFEIVCPTLPEQKKIAEILAIVDESIEKTNQIIEKTKEAQKGLMQKLLTCGIGHTKFKKTEVGEIPEEWEVIKLGTLTETITKGTTPTTYGFNFTESGTNFVKVESIDEDGNFIWENIPHISEEANKALNRSILRESDILFSIAGALGRVAIVNKDLLPANTNQALAIIRLEKNGIAIVGYLKYYLMGPIIQGYIERIAVQSAQANLSLKQVNDLLLSLPPLHEQKQIADILSSIDAEIEKETTYGKDLENLKKGLMQVLLTGKIRVSLETH